MDFNKGVNKRNCKKSNFVPLGERRNRFLKIFQLLTILYYSPRFFVSLVVNQYMLLIAYNTM